jgi:diguanylate cyclase (GGDEF)-like protein/PAS domain S-box-containing protein
MPQLFINGQCRGLDAIERSAVLNAGKSMSTWRSDGQSDAKGNTSMLDTIRLLLVEDEPADAELVRIALRTTMGPRFHIEWAHTLSEARQLMEHSEFDALLLDLSLPDSEGLDTLLIANQLVKPTPIIVLTGRDDLDFALAALEVGAADYMVKGEFGYEGLARAIRYALQRTKMEAQLTESNARFRHFFESGLVGMGIISYDQPGGIFNQRLCEMLGYSSDEIQALHWQEITHPEDWPAEAAHLDRMKTGGIEGYAQEKRFMRKDGSVLHVSIVVRCQRNSSGQIERCFVIVEDTTARWKAQEALRERQEIHSAIITQAVDSIALIDAETGRFVEFNEAACLNLGYTREDFAQLCIADIEVEQTPKEVQEYLNWLKQHGEHVFETRHRHRNGECKDVRVSARLLRINERNYFAAIWSDITERKKFENQLRLSDQVVKAAAEAILVTDPKGIIESVNPAFTQMTGYESKESIGKTPRFLQSGRQSPAFYQEFWRSLATEGGWQGEIWNRRKDGTIYPQWLMVREVRDEQGVVRHYVAVASDLTVIRQAELEMERMARYDALTGLCNRGAFCDTLNQILSSSHRDEKQGAVALLNLRRFRELNEARGVKAGDCLLQSFAERLVASLYETDLVARLGADEFAVLLLELGENHEDTARSALVITERLLSHLDEPFNILGEDYRADIYLGITLFPHPGQRNAADVLREMDTAVNRLKREPQKHIAFFEEAMGETTRIRFALERELRRAIVTDELRLYLQPQVDYKNSIIAFEALIRWQHPERGLLTPNAFIPIAEESDLIVKLDHWVLVEVLKLLTGPDLQYLSVAVNLSPRHFEHHDFVSCIRRLLAESGAEPKRLVLEVTEGLFLNDPDSAARKMQELSELGVRFSLDDFGTGYSALAYLKRLPIHELKIDRSFIHDLPDDSDNAALVKVILSVARHLHLHVVAEGVENLAQAELLWTHEKNVAQQGFFHGMPEPAQYWIGQLPKSSGSDNEFSQVGHILVPDAQ